MKKHILSILCGPVLACNALAFSDASASWVESERACLRAIEAANRPVIPAAPPEAWPLILLLALLLAVSAPGLAKLTRAGLDAVCAFSRDTSRPAFLAGMILVTAALFCGAGKFPTNPVTEIIETVISQTQTPATSAPAVMPETVIPADEEDNAAGLMPATDGNASMLFTSKTGTSATSTSASLAASGLALVSATNAVPGWWERPAWASAYAPWALGAHEDAFGLRLVSDTSLPIINSSLLTLTSPSFPVGTNLYDKLFVSSSGTISFQHRGRLWPDASPVPDGAAAPLFAVLRGPLGLAPGVGAFWYGSLSNRILLTWQDVYLGRDSNLTASAQAALDPTGDFLLRVKLPASGLPAGFITAAQNNGGGSAFAWDANALALAASPGGIEIRGRGFGFLPAGAEEGDADEDGLANLAEIAGVTHPLRPDSDFDGLGDAAETAGTNPVNPDTDGDGAADSLDPQPLIFTADAVLACCTNTWLFHVQNGLAVDGTSCQLAGDAEAWRSERFPVTVTLNAAVPPPGAVLRVGDIPLILREPGTHTLWLPRSSAWHVRLCRQWDFPVDYSLTSPEPGFIFEPAGTQPPAYSGIRYEGVMAVPTPLTVEPTNACFHGKPITFTATGPSTGLSGTYTWTYGSAMIITNAPAATFAPDSAFPDSVSVTFMPRLAQPPPQSGRLMMLSANADGWPTGGNGPCKYCGRYRRTSWNHECDHGMWCEKTGTEGGCSNSPAYVPPADGTNTWGGALAVNRRAPAPARPAGGTSFTPNPRGHGGYTLPPPEPVPGAQWMGDHWHYAHDCDCGLFDCSGCCTCPEHNGGGGSSSSQPVKFESSDGVAVAYFSFEGGSWPLSAGGTVHPGGGVYVTGQTPSTSPLDRRAVFTREDPENHETYCEYDRFTVMSLDLQTDHNADGQISAADAPSLALDWNREWRIPANTNAWFPVKVFKDVALPGVYKVSVTGSTNIIVRYGGTCVRGGEPEEVAFPQGQSQETLEVQAAAPETATLTVSFSGTGTATNYNCSTYVSIKAFGTRVEPDMNGDNIVDETDDALVRQQRNAGAAFDALYGVASNVFHRITFSFSGDIPSGDSELRLVLRGDPGAFRIRANLLDPPLAVSSAQGTECTLSAGSGFGDRTLLLECLSPSSGSASCVYRNGDSDYLTASSTVSFVAADIGLCTDTDNDGAISEDPDAERSFAQYAPGRILVMKGNADGSVSNSPRAETRFRLKPDILAQSGVVTLTARQGASRVGLWDAQQGGDLIPPGTTYTLPQMPPQTLWVSGVSTGTAVLAASYAMVPGGQSVSNLTAYTVIPPISMAPASSNAYVWCSLPSLGTADSEIFDDEFTKQGFNVEWFNDTDGITSTNFGRCTLANYKKMAASGAITSIAHGSPGYHYAVHAPYTQEGMIACNAWRTNEIGMATETFIDDNNITSYCVSVSSTWFAINWKPSLDANNAVALWSICYSADSSEGTSVKEAAGGRWRGGYLNSTDETESTNVNEMFLKRMNGSTDGALKRTAGAAYDGGNGYTSNLRVDGNAWTTLCPAPLAIGAVYPAVVVSEKRKGWGCILLDTALYNIVSAADAVVKMPSGVSVSDFRWLSDDVGRLYGIGFQFDKTSNNGVTTMKAISEKIRNDGTGPRQMDGNGIQPNTDDKQWSF